MTCKNCMKFKFQCQLTWFYCTIAMLVVYMLFMAILIIQRNSLIAAKENMWPAKPKIVIVWPFTENNFLTTIPPNYYSRLNMVTQLPTLMIRWVMGI